METTVTLDECHYQAAVKKAQELGTTPGEYIASLIDAATSTVDEILAPVREGFRSSGTTEEELDDLVARARKAIREASDNGTGQ